MTLLEWLVFKETKLMCSDCKKLVDESDFSSGPRCKACDRKKRREWREARKRRLKCEDSTRNGCI